MCHRVLDSPTPSLRTCLCFLARAAKQSSSHFSSEEQLGNLLPAPFPLPSFLSLPPLLQSHSHICICAFQPCNEDQKGCCDGQNWSSSRWILMKGNLISTAKLFNEPLKLQPQIMHIQNYAFVHRRGKISKTGSPWSALKANPCLPSWFPISMCAIIQAAQPARCIECTMALEGPAPHFHITDVSCCVYTSICSNWAAHSTSGAREDTAPTTQGAQAPFAGVHWGEKLP